ncbi:MAG: hypothetical protein EZS28_045779, partial [Streblomastix strix]
MFISQNPLIFNIFQRYKYNQLDEIEYSKIEQFLGLIKDTISANDDKIYEYLLNQFTYIVQKTSKKSETAVILQGLQAGYSSKNIIEIDEIVGNFNSVIENQKLAVPNELKNCGEQKTSNMDAMKSIMTEGSFRINAKYVPRHEAENVINLIIVTYNLFPIKIENSDRHICSFNPRDIPMTEAKKDIIRASRLPVDYVIIKHFKAFLEGITIPVTELWKPTEMWLKNCEIMNKNA